MKKALCFIYNEKYNKQGHLALKSAKLHNPDYTTIHLTDNIESSIADIRLLPKNLGLDINDNNWLIIGRVAIVQYALKELDYDSCIFIDGDTYTYNDYHSFQEELDKNYSLVVVPHLTSPLPEDGLYPQNRTISLAGNYNTGFWGATKKSLPFIEWWRYQTTMLPQSVPEAGLASEQGWLRFACDFDDNVKVFRKPGYNLAYWNIKQYNIDFIDNQWKINNQKLSLIHFSGLKQEVRPEHMSVYQNRYLLNHSDPVYILYKNYYDLIWTTP